MNRFHRSIIIMRPPNLRDAARLSKLTGYETLRLRPTRTMAMAQWILTLGLARPT